MRARALRRPAVTAVAAGVLLCMVVLVAVLASAGARGRSGAESAPPAPGASHEASTRTADDVDGVTTSPSPAPGEETREDPLAEATPAGTEDPALTSAPIDVVELPAVGLSETADFGTGVSAKVVSAERVEGQAHGPGERSGPALALTVEIVNGTDAAISLDHVVVNLADADTGRPGSWITGDPRTAHFSGELLAAESRVGVYVIRLPAADVAAVRVDVSYGAQAPTVVFSGEVPA